MDYNAAEQQISQIQAQSQDVMQRMQTFAQKLPQVAQDSTTGRELAMDIREIAMGFKQQQQQMMFLLQQMGQHIQELENAMNSHPNPPVQTRGWGLGGMGGGGGFLGTLTTGLGLGAGMAVGEDLVDDVFNLF